MEAHDDQLAYRAARGDMAAFEELVRRHQDRVYRICVGIMGDRAAAWDASQETFLRAYRAIGRYRPAPSFVAWLSRITINACRNELRRAYRRHEGGEFLPENTSEPTDPAALAEGAAERQWVWQALGQLPTEAREVLILREYQGLSYEEIAEVLGVRIGTVRSRLHRARERLGEVLKSDTAPVSQRAQH